MSYDPEAAERVRRLLSGRDDVVENERCSNPSIRAIAPFIPPRVAGCVFPPPARGACGGEGSRVGGSFRSVPPTPAYRSRDFADPPHRFAGGGKTNKLVLATRSHPSHADAHQQETLPLLIFVRLLRRWRPVGHDQRSARMKNVGWVSRAEPQSRNIRLRRGVPTSSRSAGSGGFRFALPTLRKQKEEAERRKAQTSNLRTLRRGAAPTGAARLSAFHRGSCPRDCSSRRLNSGQASWAAAPHAASCPRQRRAHFQRCTSRASHSAGRHDA